MMILRWFLGPVGKWVTAVLLLTVWTVGHRVDAARKARADVTSSVLQAKIDQQTKRADEAERQRREAQARADETAAELAALEGMRDDLLVELEGGTCDLPSDLRERLRELR